MKVIVYDNRKIDPVVIDASDEDAAFLFLFDYLDTEWDVYEDLRHNLSWDVEVTANSEHELYLRAKAGNATAARRLLTKRGGEYEAWSLVTLTQPTTTP